MINKNLKIILGLSGIVVFTSLLMWNFGQSIGSYVSFEVAAKNENRAFHVVGSQAKNKPAAFSMDTKSFRFHMTDEIGNTVPVIYPKPKPSNFDQAEKIVVIGEMKQGVFYANEMLLKCPSKYNNANAAQFEPAS